MSEITYRDGHPSDRDDIVEFQLAMARETEDLELDRDILTQGVERVFHDPSHGRYFIAESGGVVAASLLITYEWSDWRNGLVWWIQSVYVLPEFRRKGIYRGLYSHIRSLAEANCDVKGIRLYVDRNNLPAQQVYTSLGMNGDH